MRVEMGLTQIKLAELAGCSTATIKAIESYRLKPGRTLAQRIQQVLRPNLAVNQDDLDIIPWL